MKKYNVQICSRPSSNTKKFDCCKVPTPVGKEQKICVLECKECCKGSQRSKGSKTPKQSLCVLKEECCGGKNVYQIVCKDDSDACGDSCGDQDNSSCSSSEDSSSSSCGEGACSEHCCSSSCCHLQTCSSTAESSSDCPDQGAEPDSCESFVLTPVRSKKCEGSKSGSGAGATRVFVMQAPPSGCGGKKKGGKMSRTRTQKFKIVKCCK